MSYFTNFPNILYKFGNNETETVFQDISAYVQIIDEIKDNINFYSSYTILEGERPDQLSQKLYGTPSMYWTFFLMNDNVRQLGWPLTQPQIQELVAKQFPKKVITTVADLTGIFKVGQTITGLGSGATGTIISRRLDFGQLVINTTGTFIAGELITSTVGTTTQSVLLSKGSTVQYETIHHWEDSDGDYVDIDPSVGTSAIYTPITFYEKYVADNDLLRTIKTIKPIAVNSVYRAFNESLR
jgi:hypothetical protein